MIKNLEKALMLRADGKLKESNEILVELCKLHPEDAVINYQCAWSFDILELEKEAIDYYEKAISIGLSNEDLSGAILGLGSTYRTIGEYEKSREVFEKGIELFNEDNAIKTFYAMTLYNLGEYSKAMEILLKTLVNTSEDGNIKEYSRSIEFYSTNLDKIW